MRTKGRSKTALLLTGLLVAVIAATDALAQTPYANAILYEIREDINCNPGGTTTPLGDPLCQAEAANGFGTRIADATLVGGVPPFVGGVAGPPEFTGSMTIDASSVLSEVDWTGPIHGKFTVQNVLGKTVTGTLSGQLDLSQLFQNILLAPVSGHWSGTRGTLKASGTFAGVFLLPFCFPGTGCFYLDPTTGSPLPVALDEFVLVPGVGPVPLVKLLVTLYTK